MIKRYQVVSELGIWTTVLDEETANEWVELANEGGCKNLGWQGTCYKVVVQETFSEGRVWRF